MPISTHRTQALAMMGSEAVEVISHVSAENARSYVASNLDRGPYPPCPYSGYVKPRLRDLWVRIETSEWIIVFAASDATKPGRLIVGVFSEPSRDRG